MYKIYSMVTPALTNDDGLLRPPHSDSLGSYLIFSGGGGGQTFPGQLLTAAADVDEDCKPTRLRGREDEEVNGACGSHPGWLQLGLGVGGCRSSSSSAASVSKSRDFFRRPVVGVYSHRGQAEDDARRAYLSSVGRMPHSVGRPQAILSASSSLSSGRVDGGEVRVVGRPRRPQAGLWLVLQAASPEQQVMEELCLPQISRSYLRIKDGRMTVRLLTKYLANKLRLEDESQVEITCRGQQLPPFLTLTTVRENIWFSPHAVEPQSADSSASSAKYVMNLLYRRSQNRWELG